MRIATILAAAPPLAASAQTCPTQADLMTGVTLYDSALSLSVTHRIENGVLIMDITQILGDANVSFSSKTPHPLALSDDLPINGARYNGSLDGLDDLGNGREWSKDFTIIIQRSASARGRHSLSIARKSSAQLGPCTYEVWILDETFTMGDGIVHSTQRAFAPDLGIVVAQSRRPSIAFELSDAFRFDQITAE